MHLPSSLPRLLLIICLTIHVVSAGQLRIEVVQEPEQKPVAGRIHLKNSAGQPQSVPSLPFWRDHFVCDGAVDLKLPPGRYTYEVERGPEFNAVRGEVTVAETGAAMAVARMTRLADLAKEGWWSGETHIHRPWQEAELLLAAEDLHVGHFITWWNRANLWTNSPLPYPAVKKFEGNRFYHVMGGEDERDGGALLYLDLPRPLDIVSGRQHYPSSVVFSGQARESGARWIDAEKPFWWDLPMWVAHGFADSVGLANNHMQRSGMLNEEAWGKPRDPTKFPGIQGNGRWTQEIYYHLLNCGIRIPPSAGSASGVLPNPPGYNRVYVHCGEPFTYEKWRDGLLAGRTFVSNGPLLRCRASGELPGHIFRADRPLTVTFEVALDSRDPIAALELVHNGRVEPLALPRTLTLENSGWFLVRATAALTNTFRFASTAPWYVEIGKAPPVQPRVSSQFFVDWCEERMTRLKTRSGISAAQKAELLQPWEKALEFWRARAPSN